jgi:hypothetical protein
MHCPGSVLALDGIRETRTSEFAAEGTVGHEVRADSLEFGLEPHDFIGQQMSADGFTFEVDEEMADYLQPGIDWLREQPGELFVEHRVNLSTWLPGQFGTLDAGICSPNLIIIDDLKFGRGVPVSPVENWQLMIYALGFWDNIARRRTNATDFLIRIDQPRCAGGGGEWRTTLDELLAFGEEVRAAGIRTEDPDAPLSASLKGCQWCLKKPTCDEHARFNLELMSMKFEDVDEADAVCAPPTLARSAAMTPERRGYILRHRPMLTAWLEMLHADALDDAMTGRPTPGYKAVAGRKLARRWRDKEAAERLLVPVLGDLAFTKKLNSPAAVETIAKPGKKKAGHPDLWTKVQNLITQDDGKPCLVSEDDPRPRLLTVDEKFDDVEEEI